jgi:hypothetical protein
MPEPEVLPSEAGSHRERERREADSSDTVCPRCGESQQLAKVKGCIRCLACGFKFDCNGW